MASTATYNTQIIVSAINRSQQVFAGINKSIDQTSERLNRFGTQMQLAGFRAAAAVGFPAQRLIGGMLSAGKEMSEAQNQLESVIISSIKENGYDAIQVMDELEAKARSVAAISKFDAIEVTQAQMFLGRAGLGSDEVLGSTKATVASATALAMDVGRVADKLSNTVLSFQMMPMRVDGETPEMYASRVERAFMRAADVVSYSAANANVSGEQMFESFKSLGPVAVGTGSSMERMAAMLSIMGNKGVQGAEAGVALRSSIARMLAPTKKVRENLAALNVDLQNFVTYKNKADPEALFASLTAGGAITNAQLEPLKVGISAILGDTSIDMGDRLAKVRARLVDGLKLNPTDAATLMESFDAFASSTTQEFNFEDLLRELADKGAQTGQLGDIFGKYHYTKIAGIIQELQRTASLPNDALDEMLMRIVRESGGSTMDMLRIQMKGLFGSLERLRTAWSNLMIGFAGANEGPLTIIIAKLIDIVNWLGKLDDGTQQIILLFSAISVAAGPLLIYFGLVAQGAGALLASMSGLVKAMLFIPRLIGSAGIALAAFGAGLPIVAIGAATLALREMGVAGGATAKMAFAALLSASNPLGSAIRAITDVSGPNAAAIQRLTGHYRLLKDHLVGAWDALRQGDTTTLQRKLSLIRYSLKQASDAVFELAGAFGNVVVGEAFGGRGRAIIESVKGIYESIRSSIGSAAGIIYNFTRIVIQAFQGLSSTIGDSEIGSFIGYIFASIATGAKWVASILSEVDASIKSLADSRVVVDWVRGVVDAASAVLAKVASVVAGMFGGDGGVGDFVRIVTESIESGVRTAVKLTKQIAQEMSGLPAYLTPVAGKIASWIGDGLSTVLTAARDVWAEVTSIFTGDARTDVGMTLSASMTAVVDVAREAWDAVVGIVRGAWAAIDGLMRGGLPEVDFAGVLRASLDKAAAIIRTTAGAISSVSRAASDAAAAVYLLSASIAAGIYGFLDGLGAFDALKVVLDWITSAGDVIKKSVIEWSSYLNDIPAFEYIMRGLRSVSRFADAASKSMRDIADAIDPAYWMEYGRALGSAVRFVISNAIDAVREMAGVVHEAMSGWAGIHVAAQAAGHAVAYLASKIAAVGGAAGSLSKVLTGIIPIHAIAQAVGRALYGILPGMASVRAAATGLSAVLAAMGVLLYRVFLSPRALGIFLITEALIALYNSAEKVTDAIRKMASGDVWGGLKGIGSVLKEAFSTPASAAVGTTLAAQIAARMIGAKRIWKAAGLASAGLWSIGFRSARALTGLAAIAIAALGRAAWKVAGAAAAALWSVGFKAASLTASIVGPIMGSIGSAAWRGLGLVAGATWSAGFRVASAAGAVGGRIAATVGGSIAASFAGAAGRWGLAAMKLIGKGLLRAIPFVGFAVLAYELGSYLWGHFGGKITEVAGKVKDWLAEKLSAAMELGKNVIEKVAEAGASISITIFTAITTGLATIGGGIWDALVAAADFVMAQIADLTSRFAIIGTSIADAIMGPVNSMIDGIWSALNALSEWTGFGSIGGVSVETPEAPDMPGLPDMGVRNTTLRASEEVVNNIAKAPATPPPFEMQKVPMTFGQAGVSVQTGSDEQAKLNRETLNWLKENGVNVDGDVTVKLTLPKGVTASGVAKSNGDVPIRLNTGRDPLSP